jgi:hypothetical protein
MIGLALNEELNQLKIKTKSFKFLEKTFTKDYNLHRVLNYTTLEEKDNYLIKSLASIVAFKKEKLKDKENEDSCKLLAEWLIDYTKYLIKIKFLNVYNEELIDFSEISGELENRDLVKKTPDQSDKDLKVNNIVELRKAKMLKKLNQMQAKFVNTNKDFLEELNTTDLKEPSSLADDVKDETDGSMR